jgi:chromosomal replication initiator protein
MVKQALRHIIEDIEAEVNVDFIQKTVAEFYHIPVTCSRPKPAKRRWCTARQVAMYFAKSMHPHSLKSHWVPLRRGATTTPSFTRCSVSTCGSRQKLPRPVCELRKKL